MYLMPTPESIKWVAKQCLWVWGVTLGGGTDFVLIFAENGKNYAKIN